MKPVFAVGYAVAGDAAALETLFRAIVAPLDIYNETARQAELDKYRAEDFARLIAADPRALLLARRDDGEPVGFAHLVNEHGPIWLEWYGVVATARGHGVGTALLQFVVAEAARLGAARVHCDTRTENHASNALLRRLGFRQLRRIANHYHGQDFFLWELELAP